MKIILFGGSFDPIHKGHIEAAKRALSLTKADKLYFIPTFSSPTNKEIRSTFSDRIAMLKLAISRYKKFHMSEAEKKIEGKSYTWKTIEYFKNKFPKADIYLLVGSDQYNKLESWKNYEYIIKNSIIICANRQSVLIRKNKTDILINDIDVDISSTELVSKINNSMMDRKVLNYINSKGLYWKQRLNDWKLTDYRIGHSIAVANLAKKIGNKVLPNLANDLWVAGIYHDIAKDLSKDESIAFVNKYIKERSKNYPSWKVLHPYIGRYILENYYSYNNKRILSAIENHTIMEDFTKFNKILYCADKLVNRPDDSEQRKKLINKILNVSYKNIDKAYELIVNELLNHKDN